MKTKKSNVSKTQKTAEPVAVSSTALFAGLHSDITEWSIALLNADSDTLIASREWRKNDEDFCLFLKSKISTYVQPKYSAEKVWIEDHIQDVWRFGTQEELDEMIRFLSSLRDSIPPASRFEDEANA